MENYDLRKKEYEERKLAQQNAENDIQHGLQLAASKTGGDEVGVVDAGHYEDWGTTEDYNQQQGAYEYQENGYAGGYVEEDGVQYQYDNAAYQADEAAQQQQYAYEDGSYQQGGYQEGEAYDAATTQGQEAAAAWPTGEDGYPINGGYAGYEADPNQQHVNYYEGDGEGYVYQEGEGVQQQDGAYQQEVGYQEQYNGEGGVPQEYQQASEATGYYEGYEGYNGEVYQDVQREQQGGEGTFEQQQDGYYDQQQQYQDAGNVYDNEDGAWAEQPQQPVQQTTQMKHKDKGKEKATPLGRAKKRIFLEDNSDDDFEDPPPRSSYKRKADALSSTKSPSTATTPTTTTADTTTGPTVRKPLNNRPSNAATPSNLPTNGSTAVVNATPTNPPVQRATLHLFRYEKKRKTDD